jgi:two-component system NtrC family sensor kinase
METVLAVVRSGTAESLLIFNLFHLLLAGVTLFVLLYQLRPVKEASDVSDRLLAVGFSLIALRFGISTVYFGARFFYGATVPPATLERVTHAVLTCALIIIVAAFRCDISERHRLVEWVVLSCIGVMSLAVVDAMQGSRALLTGAHPHSAAMVVFDLGAIIALAISVAEVGRTGLAQRRAYMVVLGLFGCAFLLHLATAVAGGGMEVFVGQAEEFLVSAALFGFAWLMGERSPKLLDRIFVRLNLTFIVLAVMIMTVTAAMEKYQYIRLAEQRALPFSDFLLNEINRYGARGEDLEHILHHTSVADRVVAEFGNVPELREVKLYLDAQQARFRYTDNWSVRQEVVPRLPEAAHDGASDPNIFPMLIVPLDKRPHSGNRMEFLGTMDYINRYIGKYIIFIYAVFTVVVVMATGIIGIIVAETDRQLQRKYAEVEESHRRLAQAAKLASIGELAGGMAHEINTPITSILSLATHMAEDRGSWGLSTRQRSSLQLIARQAERVSRIVGGLLNFSRQSNLRIADVEVAEVLETAITLMQYRLDAVGIQVQRTVEPGLSVRADAGALTEVVLNLLTNAIDAMPTGGVIRIRACTTPEGVRLEVVDAGIGILPEQLPRIFDPFYTTKDPGRGTGLGLSVSHGIVKRHGGEIWAESTPGAGTTFVVTLPAEAKV